MRGHKRRQMHSELSQDTDHNVGGKEMAIGMRRRQILERLRARNEHEADGDDHACQLANFDFS